MSTLNPFDIKSNIKNPQSIGDEYRLVKTKLGKSSKQ
jgi:hypothetical protein